MSTDQDPHSGDQARAIRIHPAKGSAPKFGQMQGGSQIRFSSLGQSRPRGSMVRLPAEYGSGQTIDPATAEVVGHLIDARISLERLSTRQYSLTQGPAFPHFDEANRSIHSALIALGECAETLQVSRQHHAEAPFGHPI